MASGQHKKWEPENDGFVSRTLRNGRAPKRNIPNFRRAPGRIRNA
jgi:hypothetical protein